MIPPHRPFTLNLKPWEAAMIVEHEGAFVIEPMRFLTLAEAKARRLHKHTKRAA